LACKTTLEFSKQKNKTETRKSKVNNSNKAHYTLMNKLKEHNICRIKRKSRSMLYGFMQNHARAKKHV
jgi:hypothetical protein